MVAAATGINFAGAGVAVTDAGSNEALVTIPGATVPFPPHTVHPTFGMVGATSVLASNFGHALRALGAGAITKIGIYVGASSGNIDVGIARASTPGGPPATLIASSGSIACPAGSAWAEISLGGSVTVDPTTDYFVIAADNTTATFWRGSVPNAGGNQGRGFNYGAGITSLPWTTGKVGTVGAAPVTWVGFLMVGVA